MLTVHICGFSWVLHNSSVLKLAHLFYVFLLQMQIFAWGFSGFRHVSGSPSVTQHLSSCVFTIVFEIYAIISQVIKLI